MRGFGTLSNGVYPGYLRRINEGTVITPGSASGSVGMFHFVTTEAAATVEAADFFNAAAAELTKGSTIVAVMAVGGTPILKIYVVTANTGSAVTIARQTTTAG